MNNHKAPVGRSCDRLMARLVIFLLVTLSTATAFGADPPRLVARVVKLNHLAVIFPKGILANPFGLRSPKPRSEGKKLSRPTVTMPPVDDKSIPHGMEGSEPMLTFPVEEWTPTVQQVAAAEKAILHRLRDLAISGRTIHRQNGKKIDPHAEYLIQYCGFMSKKKKWIYCNVIDIGGLSYDAIYGPKDFAKFLTDMFAHLFIEADSDMVFIAYYNPATNKLSGSRGGLRDGPCGRPVDIDKNAPPPKKSMEDPFK